MHTMNLIPPAKRIGVFTPHIDGVYIGKLLASVLEEARTQNMQLTIVQTQTDYPHDTPFDVPVFIDQMDGCILLLNPLGPKSIEHMKQSGKPIVTIGHVQEHLQGHSILIDNHNGYKEIIYHLIDHGHTDIAFIASYKKHLDQQERFQAYKEALFDRGLPIRDDLIIEVETNLQQAGREGAEQESKAFVFPRISLLSALTTSSKEPMLNSV
jgi:DNA-binding LacI/PurR family transcriptional regulator